MAEHEAPQVVPFSDLNCGDRFRFVGLPELCAKVGTKAGNKFIKVGKIGGYTVSADPACEVVSRFVPRQPKEIEL
jgi:hypothetical protein